MALNDTRYVGWEKDVSDQAYRKAIEYMQDYKDGVKTITYKSIQSKAVETYMLMKVWHLLECNGIFLDIEIKKRKDKIRVMLQLYPNPI